MQRLAILLVSLVAVLAGAFTSAALGATVIGDTTIQRDADSNGAGIAEAFQATATGTGTVTSMVVYVNTGSAASTLTVGLYSNASGKPGTLLAQGTLASPRAAAWNTVSLPGAAVTSGGTYWIALLGPTGSGTLRFRDRSGTGHAETSMQTNLASLPASWTTGGKYADGPVSAYGTTTTGAPVLAVTPTTLSFSATQGGANPAAKTLAVSNTGGGTLAYTAAADVPWLSVTPASGNAPATLTVTPSIAGLAPNTYTGHVTVTSSGATGSPASVTVTLTVAAPAPPVLAVSPTTLTFSGTQGGADPAAKTLALSNTGGGTLAYTAAADVPWLSVTPASGNAPATLTVTPSISGLAPNTYTGHVTVTSSGATGSPASVTVTLTVAAPAPPVLAVSPTTLTFSATQGGADPAAKTLAVSNTGGGTLAYTASADVPWLTVGPASGNAPATLTVAPSISGLAPNTYTGHVTVTSSGATGSPATVTVTLTVAAPAPPVLAVAPTTLTFSGTQGGADPAAKTLALSNTGGGTLAYTAAADVPWLSVTPASGNAPATLTVTPSIASLAADTYTGHVTVTSSGATGSPASVTVTLTVAAAGANPGWLQIEHDPGRTGNAPDENDDHPRQRGERSGSSGRPRSTGRSRPSRST